MIENGSKYVAEGLIGADMSLNVICFVQSRITLICQCDGANWKKVDVKLSGRNLHDISYNSGRSMLSYCMKKIKKSMKNE